MKLIPKNVVRGLLLAGLVAGVTGCLVIKVTTDKGRTKCCGGAAGGGTLDNTPWPAQDGYSETFKPHPPNNPSGNSGQVIALKKGFYTGSPHACFTAADGWDKWFPLPRYLIGPVVVPNAVCFTNIDQLYGVTVSTCIAENGTVLETGIVIYEEFNPNTDKLCVTNSGCLAASLLTINTRPIEASKRYRATVFCKSAQLNVAGQVKINWSYP